MANNAVAWFNEWLEWAEAQGMKPVYRSGFLSGQYHLRWIVNERTYTAKGQGQGSLLTGIAKVHPEHPSCVKWLTAQTKARVCRRERIAREHEAVRQAVRDAESARKKRWELRRQERESAA